MINKIIDVFRDKNPTLRLKQFEKNYFSKNFSNVSKILVDSVKEGDLSYSVSMWMLKTTLDELLIVNEYLFHNLTMYNDVDEFHDILEDLISTISSYQYSIRDLEADYPLSQIDHAISNKKSIDNTSIKHIEFNGYSIPVIGTFITDLKDNNLIEIRETSELIEQHFLPNSHNESEIKPIVWEKSKVLLAYLIHQLYHKKIILVENYWADTAIHFTWKGKKPKNLKQSYNDSPNPKGSHIIDSIIEKF